MWKRQHDWVKTSHIGQGLLKVQFSFTHLFPQPGLQKAQPIYLVTHENNFHEHLSWRHSVTHPEPQRSCSVCIMPSLNYSFPWIFLSFSVNKAEFHTATKVVEWNGMDALRRGDPVGLCDSGGHTPWFRATPVLGRQVKIDSIYQIISPCRIRGAWRWRTATLLSHINVSCEILKISADSSPLKIVQWHWRFQAHGERFGEQKMPQEPNPSGNHSHTPFPERVKPNSLHTSGFDQLLEVPGCSRYLRTGHNSQSQQCRF